MGRVHHLNCGTLCPASAKLSNGTGGLLERGKMVCHCLLVETEDGLVLVDTGFGTDDLRAPERFARTFRMVCEPRFDAAETALHQIRALGLQPDDVRHIVVTHLDLDHAGGLADFPKAKVHVHAREQRAATDPRTRLERERYIPAQWAHGAKWQTYEDAGDDFFGLEAVRSLEGVRADVALIPMFGHSRGHSAVAVKDGERWLVHAGDAYFHRWEIERRPPECPPGLAFFQRVVAVDDALRRKNQVRLAELARAHGGVLTVFSAHDPVELDRFRS